MSVTKLVAGGAMAVGLVAATAGDAAAQFVVPGGPVYSRSYFTPSGGVLTKTYTPGFGAPVYGPGFGSPFVGPGFGYPVYHARPGFVYPGYGGGFYQPGFGYPGYYARPGFSIGVGFGRW